MVNWVEQVTGKSMDPEVRKNFVRGAKEVDLVYSGLSDTMETACAEVHQTAIKYDVDYRAGALISAMLKMATVHSLSGLKSGPLSSALPGN